ncbi:hypothetical protein [uncultured Algibacter sp.]|uniref:hypothetical protein n=1 Tax=uncultured Algibacter sp. TaxID=298659 RepID=UPI003216AE6E
MLEKLKKILPFFSRYYVVNISIVGDVYEYQLIEFSFKEDELLIEKRFFSNHLDDIFTSKINKDYPLLLHIEGDAIINKVVENKTGYRNDLIFKADLNDFYFYEYQQHKEIFISICRKQHINQLIEQFAKIDKFVVHISFGPFVMANLLPVLKNYSSISSSNYSLDINDSQLLAFKNEQGEHKEYTINDDTFNQRELPLLASFLGYKYPNPNIEFDISFLKNNTSEFKYKKWFKIAGIFTLVFFLVSLTVSHFLKDYYLRSLAEKESMHALSLQTTAKINTLKEDKRIKEHILVSSGIGNTSFLTKYMAEIGNSVPSDIILNTVNVIPLSKKIKPAQKIDFKMESIIILGESKNDKSFNNWLKSIENLVWIKKMDIEDYTQESNNENTFKIKIKI